MYFGNQHKNMQIDEVSLTRQCDKEYLAEIKDRIGSYDAVVSIACGAGVQFMTEMYNTKRIYPGVNTCFIGVTEEKGVWTERCQACGECILARTGGICPIARCSKRILNARAAALRMENARSTKTCPADGSLSMSGSKSSENSRDSRSP